MSRALVVCPGPEFSVADVYHGWIKGLQLCGYDVMPYDLGDRLTWAHHAYLKRMDGTFQQAFPELDDVAVSAQAKPTADHLHPTGDEQAAAPFGLVCVMAAGVV